MVFRSSRTASLDAGHGVTARVDPLQRTAGMGAEALASEWLQEALPFRSPARAAMERFSLTEQGSAEDAGPGTPIGRASTLKNRADWENAGEPKKVTAKRTTTA